MVVINLRTMGLIMMTNVATASFGIPICKKTCPYKNNLIEWLTYMINTLNLKCVHLIQLTNISPSSEFACNRLYWQCLSRFPVRFFLAWALRIWFLIIKGKIWMWKWRTRNMFFPFIQYIWNRLSKILFYNTIFRKDWFMAI